MRDGSVSSAIFYCVLMLPGDVASKDHLEFASLLNFRTVLILGRREKSQMRLRRRWLFPPTLLLDANGIILQKWPGTNRNRNVRESMARQIVSDALNQLAIRQSIRDN